MNSSAIEWTDTTWNPVTGCSKVSQGCKNCYAERMFARPYPGRDFTDVRTHPDRLDQPLRLGKPKRIFVNSMSDMFHETVPDRFIDHIFAVMAAAPQHTFQILTKRPDRMRQWFQAIEASAQDRMALHLHEALKGGIGYRHPKRIAINNVTWPLPNVWLGVSVEDQATADERIPLLLRTPAAVRFISAEPLLGPISFEGMFATNIPNDGTNALEELDLVIAGGESGPHARPSHPDWFRSLRDQCAAAGTAFFFKQWGEWAPNCLCDTACAHPDIKRPEPGKMGVMFRCGKKAAGRLLDEREHSELPA